MASRKVKFVLCTAVAVALGGTWAALRLDNARLRPRLAALQRQREQAERVRDENRQLQAILARIQTDAVEGARAIHADLQRVRTEVEELERKARASHEQAQAAAARDAENLATNRDPKKGLMRLEYFQNQGQATPAAAFQTFVWAALKGEDATLGALIAMDEAARAKGMAVVATLPEETKAKYSTPEKLAALFFAAALTAQPSAQVLNVSYLDSQHAVVQVRGLTDKTQKIPMRRGSQGWQIVVPVEMAERLGRWATGGTSAPPKK